MWNTPYILAMCLSTLCHSKELHDVTNRVLLLCKYKVSSNVTSVAATVFLTLINPKSSQTRQCFVLYYVACRAQIDTPLDSIFFLFSYILVIPWLLLIFED